VVSRRIRRKGLEDGGGRTYDDAVEQVQRREHNAGAVSRRPFWSTTDPAR
jgi:hypothetical protein